MLIRGAEIRMRTVLKSERPSDDLSKTQASLPAPGVSTICRHRSGSASRFVEGVGRTSGPHNHLSGFLHFSSSVKSLLLDDVRHIHPRTGYL
jgi:hypothetical protein